MAWCRDLRRLDRARAALAAACWLMLAPAQAAAQQPAQPVPDGVAEPRRAPAKTSNDVGRAARKAARPNAPARGAAAERPRPGQAVKPPGVAQSCAGKGFWAREWCETKACFRVENQSDPVCQSRRDQRPVNQP